MYLPIKEDEESNELLTALVSKGVLGESRDSVSGRREYEITPKGEQLLSLVEEFAQLLGGGKVFLPVLPWGRN